jgi:excisionase family DNA binding protein
MTVIDEPQLLTTSEVCALLRCHRNTIANLVARGRLAPIRISARRVLYRQADLDRLVGLPTASDAVTIIAALGYMAEQAAEEQRSLCPACGKRRVNRGASMCTWCEQNREVQLLHKRNWWDQHGNDWRHERKANTDA